MVCNSIVQILSDSCGNHISNRPTPNLTKPPNKSKSVSQSLMFTSDDNKSGDLLLTVASDDYQPKTSNNEFSSQLDDVKSTTFDNSMAEDETSSSSLPFSLTQGDLDTTPEGNLCTTYDSVTEVRETDKLSSKSSLVLGDNNITPIKSPFLGFDNTTPNIVIKSNKIGLPESVDDSKTSEIVKSHSSPKYFLRKNYLRLKQK